MISVAAELAHMHPQTLRMYEARGLIEPKRSPKNTRLYSQRDVERLRRIQQMTSEQGLNLAGVETVLDLERKVERMKSELERMRSGRPSSNAALAIHLNETCIRPQREGSLMENDIEVEGLVREFKNGPLAVDGIDLEVAPGEIYGFLGPNGAGKSTTVHMLTTLLPPTAGTARVAGYDIVSGGPAGARPRSAPRCRRRRSTRYLTGARAHAAAGRAARDAEGRAGRAAATS